MVVYTQYFAARVKKFYIFLLQKDALPLIPGGTHLLLDSHLQALHKLAAAAHGECLLQAPVLPGQRPLLLLTLSEIL